MSKGLINVCRLSIVLALFAVLQPVTIAAAENTEFIKYARADVRAWYVYESIDEIDWPTVYYLNETFGCRVSLVHLITDGGSDPTERSLPDRQLFMHTVVIDTSQAVRWGQALGDDLTDRNPDLIIIAADSSRSIVRSFRRFVAAYQPSADDLFGIARIYLAAPAGSEPAAGSSVWLNSRVLGNQFHERMHNEIPLLLPGFALPDNRDRRMIRYDLLDRRIDAGTPESDFFSGMSTLRLSHFIDSLFSDGPMKQTLADQATAYQALMAEAEHADDQQAVVEKVLAAYRELLPISRYRAHSATLPSMPSFEAYLDRLESRAEEAILHVAGLYWEGRVLLRDSPHGPKVKFIASVSNAGTESIELAAVQFQPYWQDEPSILQQQSVMVAPHQSYVREYLIDIDPAWLEADRSDSLLFVSTLILGDIPFEMTNSLPVNESLPLGITFEPNFRFVDPSARTDVDRVVAALNWKVIITKPTNYAGMVHLELETPRGMFAGAYRQDIRLLQGTRREVVGIPFTLSKLFEFGRQEQTIAMSADGILVAVDTGYIRAAACQMPTTLSIGILPDSSGRLEDVLRMAGATYRQLTERSLELGELAGYDVIVLGSGCFRRYPNLRWYRDRLEEFIRNGGSVVLFGQPDDWPAGILPVSFVPDRALLRQGDITSLLRYANVLSRPYEIDQAELLSWYDRARAASPAEIAPSEKVFVAPEGESLLSVSRLGQGQLIYCGLPLLDMVADLELAAIHLFSNLMNY